MRLNELTVSCIYISALFFIRVMGTEDEEITVKSAVPEHCSQNKFQCDSGQCIPQTWVCDRDNDCDDGDSDGPSSDERGCVFICGPGQFKCNSTECIPAKWQCDGMQDCRDGSDEVRCQERQCPETDFRCNSTGRCIPWAWVCDGEDDCRDKSDETVDQDCLHTSVQCGPNYFVCHNGKCIAKEYYCDSDYDCEDKSDEPDSCQHSCQVNEFLCANKHCVAEHFKCNGVDDCGDGSDESSETCGLSTSCLTEGSFLCENGLCVNETLLCDGANDCGDFSDEALCSMSNPCRIQNGGCEDICQLDVAGAVLCSCYGDRRLLVDERRCVDNNNRTCGEHYFQCSTGSCVPFHLTCDGVSHCEDDSDEDIQYCTQRSCRPNYFQCHNGRCIFSNLTCNHVDDCGDASDELNCTCLDDRHFRCASGQCILSDFRCDTDPDCPDASDEMGCRVPEFLFYSMTSDIKGMLLDEEPNGTITDVLGPISQVSVATSIDFHAADDYLYWADSDHGSITRIRRDGTGREVVVKHFESMDSIPIDWLTGLAVDWIAGNLYWTDPKFSVIEMSRLNGLNRYIVVAGDMERPAAIALDPEQGLLFWSDVGKQPRLERAYLDGSGRMVLVNQTMVHVNDIALDYDARKLYWCESTTNTMERMNYDGTEREVVLEHPQDSPFAISIYNNKVYWIDLSYELGSIKVASTTNVSDYTVLVRGLGESLKDIQVFAKAKQKGTNLCAKDNGGCAELCLFNGTQPMCACAHGKVAADKKTCEDYDSFLVYSRVQSIDSIHMFDKFNLNAPFPSIQSSQYMRNAIGLSFDYQRSKIFYSDIQLGSINSVFFNGTNHTVIVERQGSVEGLAYEMLHNSLYWTCNNDATINKKVLDGKDREVELVIKLGMNDKPRGIEVDSCDSRIYWTNWNSHNPSIQRAYTNGYGLESIITTEIRLPNALALDHKSQKLYWGDARYDKIERAEYDGSNRVILNKVKPQHAFDIAVYGDYIFWTDWVLHAVIRANKYSGDDVVWLRTEVPRPMGIIAVANDTNDCMSNPCRIQNGGCEDICQLDVAGAVLCSCYGDRRLLVDERRCVDNNNRTCGEHYFQCSTGSCVPFHLTCDGVSHCEDDSDEDIQYCTQRSCRPNYFQCHNGRCIFSNLTCNHVDDCGDASDELNCTCLDDRHFRCASGQCILSDFRCDTDPDCPDASDEMGCLYSCGPGQFKCNCTECIPATWQCDGMQDCHDGSDEVRCRCSASHS